MALRPLPSLSPSPETVLDWRRSVQDALRFAPLFGQGAPTMDAPIGTLYVNATGSVGAVLYVKEAAGATGWAAK